MKIVTVVVVNFYKKWFMLHEILARPTSLITWKFKNQILILKLLQTITNVLILAFENEFLEIIYNLEGGYLSWDVQQKVWKSVNKDFMLKINFLNREFALAREIIHAHKLTVSGNIIGLNQKFWSLVKSLVTFDADFELLGLNNAKKIFSYLKRNYELSPKFHSRKSKTTH